MKRHLVRPHSRISSRGNVHPVREHYRGITFEFVPSDAPHYSIAIYPFGREGKAIRDVWIKKEGNAAVFDTTRPSNSDLRPNTIYLVQDPISDRHAWPVSEDEATRYARLLAHEQLHNVIQHVTDYNTSAALDAPWLKWKKRHGYSRGGI